MDGPVMEELGEDAPESDKMVHSACSVAQLTPISKDAAEIDWSSLPIVVLSHLYSYLKDSDRGNTARVCQNWYQGFYSADLWRHRHYHFGGFRANQREAARMIAFARSLGSHLRSLHVSCEHPCITLCKQFQRSMGSFFGILTWKRAKLRTIVLRQLHFERYWRYDYIRERLVSSFCRFLKSQFEIESFDMSEATLPMNSGFRILEALAGSNCRRLSSLNMEDFFHSRLTIFRIGRYVQVVGRFRKLTSLYTNYNYISDEVLETLAKNCTRNLTVLSIKVNRHNPLFHRIHSMTWKTVRRSCPRLGVSVYFEGVSRYEDLTGILGRDMPLRVLQIWTGLRHMDDDWRLSDTLRYVADHYPTTLEEASLSLENQSESIDESLLHLLQKCKYLEVLDMQATVRPDTIHSLCMLQKAYKIGLAKCHICAEGLNCEDTLRLSEITSEFELMTYERGIDFHFYANDLIFA